MSRTTIALEDTTRDLLRHMAHKGQTWDQVIKALIEDAKNKKKVDRGVDAT